MYNGVPAMDHVMCVSPLANNTSDAVERVAPGILDKGSLCLRIGFSLSILLIKIVIILM